METPNGMKRVEGVNERELWLYPSAPQAPDSRQEREVLLVDHHGKPLITREQRQLGFRPPKAKA